MCANNAKACYELISPQKGGFSHYDTFFYKYVPPSTRVPSPVTGNIPEILDNGEVTEGTHAAAGQLALALTPYAQVADLAVNTAASGNNAAAIQSLDGRVTAELASKLDSSALAPASHF